jgi:predicted RNA binding protein YcfA (HicA-like mRNA interferase family)
VKLPRGISADSLLRALERLGYKADGQQGSQIRLLHDGPPAHAVTIPRTNVLKTGTLRGILTEAAQARGLTIEAIVEML